DILFGFQASIHQVLPRFPLIAQQFWSKYLRWIDTDVNRPPPIERFAFERRSIAIRRAAPPITVNPTRDDRRIGTLLQNPPNTLAKRMQDLLRLAFHTSFRKDQQAFTAVQ